MAAKKLELNDKTILYQYQNGMSINRIAELNYISLMSVYRKLREMNVRIESPFMRTIDKNKLTNMYIERRWSISSIAKKHNVSYKTVRKALSKYNIPIRGIQSEENNERTKKQ